MNKTSLFSRLATYSQNQKKPAVENFTTEVLAYLINERRAFQKIFVRHLACGKRLIKSFLGSTATTQQRYPRGIVDLVLCNPRGRKILVEVKIGGHETITEIEDERWEPQVEKYLGYKDVPVAYLTTRRVSAPDVRNHEKFLGQKYFEDLYDKLGRMKRKSDVCRLFMKFMEEQEMTPPKPFTKQEVISGGESFAFIKKCVDILDEVSTAIDPEFRRTFNIRTSFSNARFNPKWQSAYTYAMKFHRGKVGRIGLSLDNDLQKLGFAVWIWTEKHPSADKLAGKLRERLHRRLRWELDGRGYSTWRYVYYPKGNISDVKRMIDRALIELRRLNSVLRNIE